MTRKKIDKPLVTGISALWACGNTGNENPQVDEPSSIYMAEHEKGLMEKAKSAGIEVDSDKAERLLKGKFTMDDFYDQIGQMQKMGSLLPP